MALFEKEKAMNEKNERISRFILYADYQSISYFYHSDVAEKPYNSYAFEW